jgi:hypothetical protein
VVHPGRDRRATAASFKTATSSNVESLSACGYAPLWVAPSFNCGGTPSYIDDLYDYPAVDFIGASVREEPGHHATTSGPPNFGSFTTSR